MKLSELRSDSSYTAKNLAPEPATNVITHEEIVEQDVLCPDLPGFRPADSAWQIIICRQFNIPFNYSLEYI